MCTPCVCLHPGTQCSGYTLEGTVSATETLLPSKNEGCGEVLSFFCKYFKTFLVLFLLDQENQNQAVKNPWK